MEDNNLLSNEEINTNVHHSIASSVELFPRLANVGEDLVLVQEVWIYQKNM